MVMTEVIKRRARNDFKTHLFKLLQHDGAQILRRKKIFEPSTQAAASVDTAVELDRPTPKFTVPGHENLQTRVDRLALQYKHWSMPGFNGFNPEDQEAIARYEKPTKFSAFKNLCMLARLGSNFHSAIAQKERDMAKAAAGFELCHLSGQFNPALLTRAEALAGVEGGCYDLDGNKTASQFIESLTGVSDPFQLPVQTDKNISERLGCLLVKIPTDKHNKLGEDSKKKLYLPLDKAKEVLGLFKTWVLCKPEMHTPSRIPRADELTLVKALHLLNHVLQIMFDMEYKRQAGSRQQLKGERIFTYALRESIDFIRFKPGVKQETNFPIVPTWVKEENLGLWTGDL
jgi:hypothetical protein